MMAVAVAGVVVLKTRGGQVWEMDPEQAAGLGADLLRNAAAADDYRARLLRHAKPAAAAAAATIDAARRGAR